RERRIFRRNGPRGIELWSPERGLKETEQKRGVQHRTLIELDQLLELLQLGEAEVRHGPISVVTRHPVQHVISLPCPQGGPAVTSSPRPQQHIDDVLPPAIHKRAHRSAADVLQATTQQ